MRQLDDTDREILRLLAADGRRPYSDIGNEVGLSGPAISSRVEQLQRLGVIEKFTITLDESKLRDVVPVLIEFDVEIGAAKAVYETLRTANSTQQVYRSSESRVVVHALLPDEQIDEWITETLDVERLLDYEANLLVESARPKTLDTDAFSISCAECGSPMTTEGPSEQVGDRLYQFCCTRCKEEFLEPEASG